MAKFKPNRGGVSVNQKKQKTSTVSNTICGKSQTSIAKFNVDKLPSGCLSYPKDFEILYSPYTWGEVRQISESGDLSIKQTVDFVLNGIHANFDKSLITLGDFMFLGYLRKLANNLAPKIISAQITCDNCNKIKQHKITENQIDFDEAQYKKLPVNIEFGNKKISFNPITIGDYVDLEQNNREATIINQLTYMMLNGDYGSFDEAHKTLYNLPRELEGDLEKINNMMYHGLKPIELKCDCGSKDEVQLDSGLLNDGGKVILKPFREHKDDVRSRITFGN